MSFKHINDKKKEQRRVAKKKQGVKLPRTTAKDGAGNIQPTTITDLSTQKGKSVPGSIIALDIAPMCTEDCPLLDTCEYQKAGRCRVHVKYLTDIYNNLITSPNSLQCSEDQLRFGLHVIPLYSQLLTFKMHESTFGLHNVMYGTKVHPIYKEIRETIKVLDGMMRSLRIRLNGMNGVPGDTSEENNENGQSDYYEQLMKSEA